MSSSESSFGSEPNAFNRESLDDRSGLAREALSLDNAESDDTKAKMVK